MSNQRQRCCCKSHILWMEQMKGIWTYVNAAEFVRKSLCSIGAAGGKGHKICIVKFRLRTYLGETWMRNMKIKSSRQVRTEQMSGHCVSLSSWWGKKSIEKAWHYWGDEVKNPQSMYYILSHAVKLIKYFIFHLRENLVKPGKMHESLKCKIRTANSII